MRTRILEDFVEDFTGYFMNDEEFVDLALRVFLETLISWVWLGITYYTN